MTHGFRLLLSSLGLCLFAAAQSSAPSSGVDVKAMDKSVDPCQDFFNYACGNWNKTHPIPAQYPRWGRFNELQDRNREVLPQILEDSAKNQSRSAVDQKLGAFYQSCMDEEAIEKAGYAPIEPGLARISRLKDKADMVRDVTWLHNQGVTAFFQFGAPPDLDKSTVHSANLEQGGLGLPDKSDYLGGKDEAIRSKYVAHASRMLQLVGTPRADANRQASAMMQLETALAKSSLDRVAMRDPNNTRHRMTVAQFQALTPDFDYSSYFADRATPHFDSLNVEEPDFFRDLNTALKSTTLEDLKSYLVWHYVSSKADLLSNAFVSENFEFYGRTLTGSQELTPRWQRCTSSVDRNLGEALGQKYAEKAFGSEAKQKTKQLAEAIEKQMAVDIDSLTWMSNATKEQALAKLRGSY